MTTTAFPTGNGGTVMNPNYYDATSTTAFPQNNATSGTTLTIKIGGSNYDSFPAASSGTTLVYAEASTNSSAAITFNGTNKAVTLVATSPSCFTSAHTYTLDVDVMGFTLATIDGTASGTGDETQTFPITTSTNEFPTGTVQLEINQQ